MGYRPQPCSFERDIGRASRTERSNNSTAGSGEHIVGGRGKGTACGAAERLGSSQFDYAEEEQKDPRDNGRNEQRAATAEPVGEEDEHDSRME